MTSLKPQAASFKPQATSCKFLNLGPWKKFHGPLTEVLNQDKTALRMLYMKCNLVWRKTYLVTLRNFKFYSEKVARSIVAQ